DFRNDRGRGRLKCHLAGFIKQFRLPGQGHGNRRSGRSRFGFFAIPPVIAIRLRPGLGPDAEQKRAEEA
ncbi:MAG TPA: hypothetical protein PKX16_09065, partial [Kiritimatiellia bacterium]|nr:hypothetical protein [Kiritimatiellia bacterium]